MILKTLYIYLIAVVFLFAFVSCIITETDETKRDELSRLNVVTTTTMITDLVYQICGDSVNLTGLMGSGVDPHLYKPTEGDVFRISNSDVIFYNGLHLEGRLEDLFRKMKQRDINTIAIADALTKENLLVLEDGKGQHDPHIWFSIRNWRFAAAFVTESVSDLDAKNADYYNQNLNKYLKNLDILDRYVNIEINAVPVPRRVLITAHDAFGYFGQEYGFEVIGLQGISTLSEAGAADVRNLAELINKRDIPAIFVESSVSDRNIRALVEAVNSKGMELKIGGTLYSDALGSAETPEGTYIGMYKHNVKTITDALK